MVLLSKGGIIMSEKREKIISRIKKLFSLAGNNPSKEEAQSAALKAQKLIAQYDIEDNELLEEITEDIIEEMYRTESGNKWKYALGSVIAKNFRCKVYTKAKKTFVFVGHEKDSITARETFKFLYDTCVKQTRAKANEARKEFGTAKGVAVAYGLGFVDGIREVLDKQCTALMLITPSDVEEKFEDITSGFTITHHTFKYKESQTNIYQDGVLAGRSAIGGRQIAQA